MRMDYTLQTRFSDPGRHRARLDALPASVAEICAVVRNLVVHYRASGIDFPPARLAEIDNRWVSRILDALPFDGPLDTPCPPEQRVVGCCRDFTLVTVAALRARGIPARSRVGFADYFEPGFHVDHVVVEWHDGTRWIATDAQLDPAGGHPVDVADVPLGPGGLRTAAQAWRAFRRGDDDPYSYGVGRDVPIRGPLMIRKYVLNELAHRLGDELLLWDFWSSDAARIDEVLGDGRLDEVWPELESRLAQSPPDAALIDEVADLLLAADTGDAAAERRLTELYRSDPRLHPGDVISCFSPRGVRYEVDLMPDRVNEPAG
ncbi:transglutaminase-like domain-containing protein [Actinoplanes sp. NPDC023714]|uniref:transglutaminase-like domain-containing protein n=1 Tax=Actinoplanes sp. NPDC023714 TaxID=3154322 RepID=UPI0033E52AE2